MKDKGLSLVDLEQEERDLIKDYLLKQKEVMVKSKFPEMKLNSVEKKSMQFLKNLNTSDFSYKGQKSAFRSEETGIFNDEEEQFGLDGHIQMSSQPESFF